MTPIAQFETPHQASRVERMTEAQIVETLREEGFDRSSPRWQVLATALAEYGYAVLVGWGVTGQLAARTAAVRGTNFQKMPPNLRLKLDDARALAADVVAVALDRFRSRSLPTWDPSRGASLKTFFIGRCLMDIGEVYERWYRRELGHYAVEQPVAGYAVEQLVSSSRSAARPDEEVEARILLDQLIDGDPVLRRILTLQEAGYSLDEIAATLATTASSVRSRTYRFRRRLTESRRQSTEEGFNE